MNTLLGNGNVDSLRMLQHEVGTWTATRPQTALISHSAAVADFIDVNVGGAEFCTYACTLVGISLPSDARPLLGSLLHRLADRDPTLPKDPAGRPFVDADPLLFTCILNFLRSPYSKSNVFTNLSPPPGYRRSQLCSALDFWGAPQLRRYIDPPIVRVILNRGKTWNTLPPYLDWLDYDGEHLKAVRWTTVAGDFLARGYALVFWTPGTTGSSFYTYPTYAIFAKS